MAFDKRLYIVLFVALVFRLVVAAFYPMVGDVMHHTNAAKYISEHWQYPPTESNVFGWDRSFFYPPIVHSTYAILMTVMSLDYSTYHFLNFVHVLAGVFSIVFIYRLVINLKLGEETALKTAFVTAFFPVHIVFSGVMYLGIYVCLFVTASTNYFLEYVNHGSRKSAFLAVVFSGLAAMTHIGGLSAIIFQLLYLLGDRKLWRVVLLSFLASSPMYASNLVMHGNPFWVGCGGFDPDWKGCETFELGGSPEVMFEDPLQIFFSPWIGGPTSGPHYRRIMEYVPASMRAFLFLWIALCGFFTILAFVGFFRTPRESKVLLLASSYDFLVVPAMARKLMDSMSTLTLSIVNGISIASEKLKVREEFFFMAFIMTSAHVIPLSYTLGVKWAPYEAEYSLIRERCENVLTHETGRVSIMCGVGVTEFGQFGVSRDLLFSGDYEAVAEQARGKGVDCVFYDDYMLTKTILNDTMVNAIVELMEYLGCEKQEVDGLGFYLCQI